VILVPLQSERKNMERNIADFQKMMNLYDPEFLYDDSVAKNLLKIGKPNPDLKDKKRLQFLAKYLSMFPFFKRITERKMAEKYVGHITIVEKNKGDIVVIPPNHQVKVILNGQVVLRHHELDRPEDFEIRSVGKSGHILFAPELDCGNSNEPLVWSVVYSQKS